MRSLEGRAQIDYIHANFHTNDNQVLLYGTTYEGGPHLGGTVYEMQKIKGKCTETPIYFFQGLPFGKSSDGTNPMSA